MKKFSKLFIVIVVLLLCNGLSKVYAISVDSIFSMKPYLQSPINNGITIRWATSVPTYSWVEYGTDKDHLQKFQLWVDGEPVSNNNLHSFRINNLVPGRTYYYRVCSREMKEYWAFPKTYDETAVSDIYSFKLPTANQKDFTALIFNDLHAHEETLNQLYNQVKDVKYDFVILNGDCISDCHKESIIVHVISTLNNKLNASSVPLYYVRGNHEVRGAYSLRLHDYLDFVNGKTYTAFNWGDTRFVVLDCGEDRADSFWANSVPFNFTQYRLDQAEFLKKELKSKAFKTANKRVLIHHIPIFGNTDPFHACSELWRPVVKNAPFDISINAHVHEFSYLPKKPNVQNYPVVIGGGPDLNDATVMVLQKKNDKMTLKVIKTNGQVILNLTL